MLDRSLWMYSLFPILGLPLLAIVLGELIDRLEKSHHPLTTPVRLVRVLLLPALVLWLYAARLLPVPAPARDPIAALVAAALAYTLLSFLNALLTTGKKRYSWQIEVPNLLFQVIRVSLVLATIAYCLTLIWRVDLSKAIGALGITSLVIALALQDTLSNLFSGFLLIIESPFKVGDWIKVGEIQGEVIEINWRAVRIRTLDSDIAIIPNGNLGKETICNYSLVDPSHALRLTMRFSYEERPHRIESILQAVALSIEGILADPAPQIEPKSYANSYIDYEIKFFITDFARAERIEGDFLKRAYYATRRHNFRQPFADRIEYTLDRLPVEIGRSPNEIGDFLQSLPIFHRIERETLDRLARAARVSEFGDDEEVVRIGEFDRAFCLVRSGTLSLSTRDGPGQYREIAKLETGDFFGEMALLLDEPSRVAVRALTAVEVIEIPTDAIAEPIDRYPHFAHLMGQLIEERTKAIRLALRNARPESGTAGRTSSPVEDDPAPPLSW